MPWLQGSHKTPTGLPVDVVPALILGDKNQPVSSATRTLPSQARLAAKSIIAGSDPSRDRISVWVRVGRLGDFQPPPSIRRRSRSGRVMLTVRTRCRIVCRGVCGHRLQISRLVLGLADIAVNVVLADTIDNQLNRLFAVPGVEDYWFINVD